MEFVGSKRFMVRRCCCGYIKQLSVQSILGKMANSVKNRSMIRVRAEKMSKVGHSHPCMMYIAMRCACPCVNTGRTADSRLPCSYNGSYLIGIR
jgi:excinuclease UvrABC nuclease subunit